MTNPTSNFGWQMPTPTDLVTDLPADFEVFGQAVDTSLADLQGGTTGQILAKATNADMDFTWITNDVGDITAVNVTAPITGGGTSGAVTIGVDAATTSASGVVQLSDSTSTTSSVLASTPTATKSAYDLAAAAVPKSTVTTAGDVIYATGSAAVTRLGIGTAGQVLTVNGGGTAPAWATPVTPSSFSNNGILNSAFQVWQRGTSFANTAQTIYTADRWVTVGTPAAYTISRQATGDTTNLPNIQYCARIQRNSGQTNTTTFDLVQGFETVNSIPFAGKTVTLSFYARKGANYSPTSSILAAALYSGTGTDQSPTAAFTGQVAVINQNATLTTTWQRFTYTASVGATATQLKTIFSMSPTGTAGANDSYDITGVQLEVGSSATDFHTNQPTVATELAACQRYFQLYVSGNSLPVAVGTYYAAGDLRMGMNYPVTMRTAPALVVATGTSYYLAVFNTQTDTLDSLRIWNASTNMMTLIADGASVAGTAGNGVIINTNNASASIAFSSEL